MSKKRAFRFNAKSCLVILRTNEIRQHSTATFLNCYNAENIECGRKKERKFCGNVVSGNG